MKNKKNVKTVGGIRREYEKYVYNYLKTDLAKQSESLYEVVRNGSFKNKDALTLAINILKSGDPMSRISCQIITNLNPYENIHAAQFVIWNDRKIRLNGSLGGNNKFICNYDLAKNKSFFNQGKHLNKRLRRKSYLLRNSLCVKFKPGPLSKKCTLDDSYQKHNMGSIKLIKLPKICLEIKPMYGASLEPTICNTLLDTREENGFLSENWAHFAASALGTIVNNRLIQCTNENNISFNTSYKNSQSRILMRCGDQLISQGSQSNEVITFNDNIITDCSEIQHVVESTIEKLLNSVEISLNQDDMYCVEDITGSLEDELKIDSNRIIKEKGKRNGELQRLDVTVIRLAETYTEITPRVCSNSFCKMGCICASLQCGYNVRKHCGRIECMFNCKCEFSKCELNYSVDDETYSQLIPTILNLEGKVSLSKEEKKFHQTVVVNNDNTILLQPSKRNRKDHAKIPSSKKGIVAENKQLMIVLSSLNCQNVQIWCMVHQLYSCFCKGRILELSHEDYSKLNNHNDTFSLSKETPIESDLNKKPVPEKPFTSATQDRKRKYIDRIAISHNNDTQKIVSDRNNTKFDDNDDNDSCKNKTIHQNNTTLSQIETGEIQLQLYKNIGLLKIWLEATHSVYRTQKAAGTYQSNLGPPTAGQLVLQPWEIILSRYKEKRNHFYVTISEPYRKFITVTDVDNTFPRECININKIRFADLPKYCPIIKNLLTNVSTNTDQQFCILHGLSNSWEIIACVKKNDKSNCDMEWKCFNNLSNTSNNTEEDSLLSFSGDNDCDSLDMSSNTNLDICKWFIMKIENDLSQLVFFRKGFFVQLDKISHAIKTARISGKTVRLSAISKAANANSPQFGIYAIPNMTESLLLVGPYEKEEKNEIKIIRQESIITDKKTSGVWLPVNRIDNIKVLKDPLLFLHKANMNIDFNNAEVIPSFNNDSDVSTCSLNSSATNETAKKIDTSLKNKFVVKPIKINKANGFYELDSNGRLKLKSPPHLPSTSAGPKVSLLNNYNFKNAMSILKPDEINKRSLDNKVNIEQINFKPIVFKQPHLDTVVVISDDEDETISDTFPKCHEVWIKCANISNLGCLHGRRNDKEEISFQFPNFKFTPFYPMQEAFLKINQVLSRKVFVPHSVKLIWKIEPKTCDSKNICVLKNEHLGADVIMTRKGLRHKRDLLNTNYAELMSALKQLKETVISDPDDTADPQKVMAEAIKLIKTLQEESKMLKTKEENLQLEHSYKQSKLLRLL